MMHSTIESPTVATDREALSGALEIIARRVIERRNTVPILSFVALGVSAAGGLHLYGTDLDLALGADIAADWQGCEPFNVAVEAVAFADAIKKLPKGSLVDLRHDAERNRLEIIAGRSRFHVRTLPLDDFPALREPAEDAPAFTLDAATFARDVAAVSPFISKEEARYYLRGVALQYREGELCTVATNGSNLAAVRRPAPEFSGPLEDALIPSKVAGLVSRLLKKPAGSVRVAIEGEGGRSPRVGMIDLPDGVRLTFKLIDGRFPEWESLVERFTAGELQAVAMPELEPRLAPGPLAALAKAVGEPLTVEISDGAAVLSAGGFPELLAISTFATGTSAKFHYGEAAAECDKARDYLKGLRERYGLPVVEGPCGEHELSEPEPETASLVTRDGRAVGLTFGAQYWQEPIYEERERLCYETFTVRRERVRVQDHALVYQDGSYSVFLPRAERPVIADMSVTIDGVETPLRRNDAGALELSEAAVRALCGEIDPAAFVRIPTFTFHHGRVIAVDGIATDGTGRRVVSCTPPHLAKAKGMSAKDAVRLHERALMQDPDYARGFMAGCQPVYLDETPAAEMTDEAPAVEMEAEAAQEPVEREEATPTPATLPETGSHALSGPEIEPETASEPAPDMPLEAVGEFIGGLIAELQERVARLEAAAAGNLEAETRAEEPAPVRDSRAIRLRIAKRYLAMRAERAELRADLAAAEGRATRERDKRRGAVLRSGQWREKYAAAQTRAIGWESRVTRDYQRAEDAEFRLAELEPRLAAAELAAKEAAAIWQPVVDAKQARIVALENELIEIKSGGRIKMPEPVRVQAKPAANAFKDIGGGCHALVISPGGR